MQESSQQSKLTAFRWLKVVRHITLWTTFCTLVVFVVIAWRERSEYQHWEHQLSASLELRGEVFELDELLSANALLAAATGDPKWRDIYEEHGPQLDIVLEEIHQLLSDPRYASGEEALAGVATTMAANSRLVAMEERAMSLAEAGALRDAIAILASDEYQQAKANFEVGEEAMSDSMQQLVRSKGRELALLASWLVLSAICLLLLICIYSALMFVDYRKQARRFQGELAENRERLELVVTSTGLALWDWNVPTGEVVFSDSFASQLGYEPHDLKPHESTWIELLHPDDRMSAEANKAYVLQNQELPYKDQFRLRTKDRNWQTVIVRGRVVARTADGSAARMVGTCLDMTDRMQLEAQLSQSQRMESIGQLAAGLAHEINTPMQFVGDNIEFLDDCAKKLFEVVDAYKDNLEGAGGPKSWEQRQQELDDITRRNKFDRLRGQVPDAISESVEGIQRVIHIVRAMKEFSHPGRESKVGVDLNNAVESTVTIARNRWKYVADLELDLDPDLPTVSCTPGELNQVLLNLIVNAADAVAEKVGVNTGDKGTITVRTRGGEGLVRVDIEDSGCGIPAEIRDRIFDPFFTTKDVGKGTGQGLALCYDVVVVKHEGTLEFDSTPGVGSRFWFTIPLCPLAATEDLVAVAPSATAGALPDAPLSASAE